MERKDNKFFVHVVAAAGKNMNALTSEKSGRRRNALVGSSWGNYCTSWGVNRISRTNALRSASACEISCFTYSRPSLFFQSGVEPLLELAPGTFFLEKGVGRRRMQMDVVPFCALQASVSYETGGWEGVSGTLWTIRACVYLPTSL